MEILGKEGQSSYKLYGTEGFAGYDILGDKLTPEDERLLTKEELKQAINKALQNAEINNIPPSQEELRVITSKAQLAKVDKCPKCNGRGLIFKTDKLHPEGTNTYTVSCPTCQGTGIYSGSGRGSDGFDECPELEETIYQLIREADFDPESKEDVWERNLAKRIVATCQGKRTDSE